VAVTRTVVVIGAGPAGLVLGNALLQAGLDCLIVERYSRADIEQRARAGMTDHRSRLILERLGLAAGLLADGRVQETCEFRAGAERVIVPYAKLNGGIGHRVYSQHLLIRDLVEAFVAGGGELLFETTAEAITIEGEASATVTLSDGPRSVSCTVVACSDGTHSIAHQHVPTTLEHRRYPYRWLTLLADIPTPSPRLVYVLHPDGFAGEMPRNASQSRFYLQYGPDEDPLAWGDDEIWQRLSHRMPGTAPGHVRQRSILEMNTRVHTPAQHGPVHLLGDAAHALPPTGGKGMNLAIADADTLASAIIARCHDGGRRLATYSEDRRPDVCSAVAFSDWLLKMVNTPLHLSEEDILADHRTRQAQLADLRDSAGLVTWFAHAYARTGEQSPLPARPDR
jgi:p-hydroxybenzoate 3-monooxygenase